MTGVREGEDEYILGTDAQELERLQFQHKAWSEQAYRLFARAGFAAGDRVLDLGSGPGSTSFELAHIVGPGGLVVARDLSERFLTHLAAEAARRDMAQVRTSLGPIEAMDFATASLDAAYARWVFCWLPDPAAALAEVARCLRPGGVLALQEYLDWGAMKLIPREPIHDAIVAACMRSWAEGGGEIDVGARLPTMAAGLGLVVEHFEPVCRAGAPGSLVWRWLGGFYESYLPRLVARGLLDDQLRVAFGERWEQLSRGGHATRIQAPTMVDIVLRKPRS